jgi:hypothetical protein
MPVTILIQTSHGNFIDQTKEFGLGNTSGWWNTLESDDLDKDGDIDFVAGNAGLNSRLRASIQQPVSMLIRDIDGNGSLDPILTYYNGGHEYPFITRDQLVKQVPALKTRYLRYESFKDVSVSDLLSGGRREFVKNTAKTFATVFLENTGNGKFAIHPLPSEVQLFPVYAMQIADLNLDGNRDILAVGNLNAVQPDIGQYDAGYGLVLLGDGKGGFSAIEPRKSGFVVPGEGRDIDMVKTSDGRKLLLVGRNNDTMLLFK